MLWPEPFRDELFNGAADQLLPTIAEELLHHCVDQHNGPALVHHEHPVRRRFNNEPELFFGLLPFCDIADDAGENAALAQRDLAHAQFEREGATVPPPPDHFPPQADDLGLAGALIIGEVTVVFRVVRFRHEQLHVLPQHLHESIAEEPFRRRIEGFDQPMVVDRDDAVHRMVHHRAQPQLLLLPLRLRLFARRDIAERND